MGGLSPHFCQAPRRGDAERVYFSVLKSWAGTFPVLIFQALCLMGGWEYAVLEVVICTGWKGVVPPIEACVRN